jgi:glycosyltransferase involved in cell wall biosynthesis
MEIFTVKKKILLIQPELNNPGGGNIVNSWLIEALKKEYDITILTWTAMDIAAVNQHCGTSLSRTEFKTLIPTKIVKFFINFIPDNFWHYQRYCALMRWCKLIKSRYDILITTCNECDFGSRGIQYVHFPYHLEKYAEEPRLIRQDGLSLFIKRWIKTRIRPWRIISGFSFARMRQNLTLVNSDWTGKIYHDSYNSTSLTVYPPVPGKFPDIRWDQKENGFVCIGRISHEKRFEAIIDILSKVRTFFPEINLHIIGIPVDYDSSCYNRVKQNITDNNNWVFLHENISRGELVNLVCQQRYGIHAMQNEHFGIAVAEMVRAGCITFVPNNGGQVDIVGKDPRLLYQTDDNAVEKIVHVLNSRRVQMELQQHLASRKHLFTAEKFMQQTRDVVRAFSDNNI